MPATTLFEDLIFGYVLRGEPFVVSSWWFALYSQNTAAPANEITTTGYPRQLVTWNGTASASNIEFPQYAGDNTTIRSVGLCDTMSSGNLLAWVTVSPQQSLTTGLIVRVAAGSLVLDITNS